MTNGLICPPGTGCIFPGATALGLPHILLWVLTFAVVYSFAARIMGKKVGAIVGIVTGFFILMAVPAAVITLIAGMSTGLIVLGIALIALIALVGLTGATGVKQTVNDKGEAVLKETGWLQAHSTAVAAVLVVLAAAMFVGLGGLSLIGITSIPIIGTATWLLIIVGVAVLWMLSD
jgi:hypothetical protein